MSSFEWTDEVTVGFTSVTVLVSTGCFRITVKINCSFLWHFFFWCLNHAYAIFVCVWIRLLCFQPLHKWNSKNYLHLIYKHGGKRFLGNTDIRARSFIFPKEVFPWHTQDIKRLLTSHYCGWFGTDIEYTIYDEKQYRGPLQNMRVELS